jgi:TonB family protein
MSAILLFSLLAISQEAELTKLPVVKKMVEAEYPPRALAERVEARVVVEFDIDVTGKVDNITVVQSSTVAKSSWVRSSTVADFYGFELAALAAATQLEFEPAEAGPGNPVPVRIPFAFKFTLPALPALAQVGTTTTATLAESTAPPGPGIVNFKGVVRERGTRKRVAGAVVTVFQGTGEEATGFEDTSNTEGEFELKDLEPGEWKVIAELDGYYPFRTTETIIPGELTDVTYYVEKSSNNPYDVLVEAPRPKKEVNRRTLTMQEAVRVPGTLGDPILVVENLPGVARAQAGQIVVRGSGPEDTDVYIDGVAVPLIYHFGGLRSVIPAEMLENIDFYPGNFSVYYGRATGGVLDARSKRPAPDQLHGSLDVSLLDTSLYLEVPIGETAAIAVAGRRSYIDFILKAVIPDDSSVSLSTAPRYYDYQILGRWRPAENHDLRLFFFGSDDVLAVVFENPGDLSPQLQATRLETGTGFNRLVGDYEYSAGKFKNMFRASIGEDILGFSLGDQFRFNLDFWTLQVRDSATYTYSDTLNFTAGVDLIYSIADVSIRLPRPPKEGDGTFNMDLSDLLVAEIDNAETLVLAPYLEAELRVDKLTLVPGFRIDYFKPIEVVTFDPRVVGRYDLDEQWTVKAGAGLVHQEPQPDETDDSFGNPDLDPERAIQLSAGAEYRPTTFLSIDATFFYKAMDQLVSRTTATIMRDGETVPQVYDNNGSGRVYGMELFIKHQLSNNLQGWLTYTLSRAERTDSGDVESRLFDFDQTHIVALVASYRFPENWELGVRWRVVSGSPTTPIVGGVFDSDNDEYRQVPGIVNSARLPLFHQLDIRVDKKWVWDTWSLNAYFSLVNSYNRPNVDGFTYKYDYSESKPQSGLPVLPILGIKAEI